MKIRFKVIGSLFLSIGLCHAALGQITAKPASVTTYFLGEVKMASPTGQPYGTSLSLVKRTISPADNQIVEIVMTLDPKQPAKEYTTVFAIKDSAFAIKDNEGTFEGTGKLTGPAWNWTGWTYTVNMLGERKGTLQGDDSMINGRIAVKKSMFSLDKQLRVVIAEDLSPISAEAYEILHSKLAAK
ncbi:MAG: hypothetical protein ABJA02_11385 [Acidobacteriota bacterium]